MTSPSRLRVFALCTALSLVALATACTDDGSADEESLDLVSDATPDATGDAAPTDTQATDTLTPPGDGGVGAPCQTSADCDDFLTCGPPEDPLPGCGEGWTCTDEQLCGAAPPYLACTCDGVARILSAGCPGQDNTGALYAADELEAEGTPCDPDDPEGFRTDLVLTGSGFDEVVGVDGVPVRIRAVPPWEDTAGAYGPSLESDGTFEYTLRDQVRPDGEGEWTVTVLVDTDRNGVCDPGTEDRVYRIVAPAPVDADLVLEVDGSAPGDDTACAEWES